MFPLEIRSDLTTKAKIDQMEQVQISLTIPSGENLRPPWTSRFIVNIT